MASALATALALAEITDRPATPPSTPVQSSMMLESCCVYTLSIGAIPAIGWVTNETEYKYIPQEPTRINVMEKITNAHTLTSISSGVSLLDGLYPMVVISSPSLVLQAFQDKSL
jgi:hypothetical protein